jgi:two-component system response regulator DesR
MIRIAVLDDHPAVLAGLRRLIDAEPDLSVAAVAASAPDLARQLNGLRPDVVILDHDLAGDDGLAHCRRIKNRPDPPAVIVYSAYAGPALSLAARAAQADAVVDKAEPVRALLTAVRRAASGDITMDPLPREAFEAAVSRLEDDDLPVFAMLLDGESLASIAETLRVDHADVSRRAQRVIGRLGPRRAGRLEEQAVS